MGVITEAETCARCHSASTDQDPAIEVQTLPGGIGNDADFNRLNNQEGSGTDTVHYRVPLNNPAENHSVEVRLLFQSVQQAFIDGLHSAGPLTAGFKQMAAQNPPATELMASVIMAINAAGGAGAAGSGGGCTLGVAATGVDPVLPAIILLGSGYLLLRRRRRVHR